MSNAETPAEQTPAVAAPAAEPVVQQNDLVSALMQLLQEAGPQAAQADAVKAVVDGLQKLGPAGLSLLTDHPVFQAAMERVAEQQASVADAPAGSYVVVKQGDKSRRIKKPWTIAEMRKRYPMVKQRAFLTNKVIVNGVVFGPFTLGGEYELPSIVWEVMDQSLKEKEQNDRWVKRWFGTDQQMGASGYYGSVLLGHGYTLDPGDFTADEIANAKPPVAAGAAS